MRPVRAGERFVRVPGKKPIILKALIDSGAQVHVTRHKSMLSQVLPNSEGQGLLKLMGASGEDLHATAKGTISELQEHVMVAEIDDDLIISTSKLAREQFWKVHPPND